MTQTIGDVLKLIRKAKAVYVKPRFGVMEKWVKISKPAATRLFITYRDDMTIFEAFDHDTELSIDAHGDLSIS